MLVRWFWRLGLRAPNVSRSTSVRGCPQQSWCVQSGEVQTDEGRRLKVFKCPAGSTVGRLGQLVEVQGEEGHAEAAEGDEQVLAGEGHSSRCKTMLTNVTEAQA